MSELKYTCPYCGSTFTSEATNPTKEWKRGSENVKRYECPNCNMPFRVYSGTKKDGAPYAYYMKTK